MVRRAVHENFSAELSESSFSTVVEAADLGLSALTGIESPSFFDRGTASAISLPGLSVSLLGLLVGLTALIGLCRTPKRRQTR